jgi:hypothetical protein
MISIGRGNYPLTVGTPKSYCDRRIYGDEKWYAYEPDDAYMRVPNGLRDCTCFLCVYKGGELVIGGTGFFLSFQSTHGHHLTWTYLVTAKHCVVENIALGREIYARINTKQGGAELTRLSDGWIYPPDPSSDAAILPFTPDFTRHQIATVRSTSAAYKENFERNLIGLGNEVIAVGLFTKRKGIEKNIPIVRMGIISALPEEQIEDQGNTGLSYHAYLVELRSLGGLSGSPVFVAVDPEHLESRMRKKYPAGFLFLLGLIRGHFDEKLMVVESEEKIAGTINAGIATVTQIGEVIETVKNNENLKSLREADKLRWNEAHSATLDSAFGENQKSDEPSFTQADFEAALKKVARKIDRTSE